MVQWGTRSWVFDTDDEVVIARRPDCDVQVADPRVSRAAHLVLRRTEGMWTAHDRSSGGSYRGDERVSSVVVTDALELRLGVGADAPVIWLTPAGSGSAVIEAGREWTPPPPPLDIRWVDRITLWCAFCGSSCEAPIWSFDEYRFDQDSPSDTLADCTTCGNPPVSVDELLMNLFGVCQFTLVHCRCGTVMYIGRRFCFRCGQNMGGYF